MSHLLRAEDDYYDAYVAEQLSDDEVYSDSDSEAAPAAPAADIVLTTKSSNQRQAKSSQQHRQQQQKAPLPAAKQKPRFALDQSRPLHYVESAA